MTTPTVTGPAQHMHGKFLLERGGMVAGADGINDLDVPGKGVT